MDAITLRNVTKRFRKRTIRHEYTTLKSELVNLFRRKKREDPGAHLQVLQGIDLVIPRGRTVGIIGRNGSGKSTLLKLMTGIYSPTSGTIEVNGRISALLELGAGFHPDFSGRENIIINGIIVGMSRAEIRRRMNDIIAFSELGDFIDEPVRNYSSGMFMRLAFSVATHVNPDILIVDEILAVGDDHFRRKSMAKMNEFKNSGNTIVLVTHDLASVSSWCDHAVWIDEGKIRLQGNPSYVVDQYVKAVHEAEAQAAASDMPAPSLSSIESLGHRREGARVTLSELRAVREQGDSEETFDSAGPLRIELDLQREGNDQGLSVALTIARSDGLQIYELQAPDMEPLRSGVSEDKTLRLHLKRLGLVQGEYLIEARAQVNGRTVASLKARELLRVSGSPQNSGLVHPEHVWELAGRQLGVLSARREAKSG